MPKNILRIGLYVIILHLSLCLLGLSVSVHFCVITSLLHPHNIS